MAYKHFEELPAWQSASKLYNQTLDLLETHGTCFSSGYRNQLDRAALSVSNNIAEGFERATTKELIAFLAIARGSAAEVRSMMAVIKKRPSVKPAHANMKTVFETALECVKQLTAWIAYLENSEIHGKRHQTRDVKAQKKAEKASQDLREQFLLSLSHTHPLYDTPEARALREKQPPTPSGNSQSQIHQ